MENRRDEDTVLKRAIRHPKRLEILGFLAGSETGCDESALAKALGEPPARLRYHLKVLQSADLVAHVGDGETTERYAVAVQS
jgi:DNA-binding transcriptional ArsR family regulator